MSRTVGGRPVKIADTNGQGLNASFKVRTYRGTEKSELVVIRRFHADNRIHAKHIGPQIQSSPAAIGRYIGLIGRHNLGYGIDKSLFGKHRHLQSGCGIHHPLRIQIRAERYDMTVIRGVCFKSLKDRLGILQYACTLVQHNIGVLRQRALIPCPFSKIGYIPVVRLHISKA